MSPAGDDCPVEDRTLDMTQGNASLRPAEEEIPSSSSSSHDPAAAPRHSAAVPADLVSSQPVSLVVDASSQGSPAVKTQQDGPCCPRCGCSVSPGPHRVRPPVPPALSRLQGSSPPALSRLQGSSPPALSRLQGSSPPALSRLQGSSLSVHSTSSKRTKSQDSLARSQIAAATQDGSCMHLLVACLWCECSALLLALLEACSSSLHALCSSCCRGCARCCARCCAALQDAPVQELRCHQQCHSVLFEACSCCGESKECMEFCLDCCDICHRS